MVFESEKSIPKGSYLVLDFNDPIRERNSAFSISDFSSPRLGDYLKAIKKAAEDEQIKGIYLKLSNVSTGWSTIKSIYEALLEFKKSKKPIWSYSDSYDEKSYYLASVANKIFLHPEGRFIWNGLGFSFTFYKGTFQKLGVQPIIFRVGKYKSAVEPLTQYKMSIASKNQMNELVDDIWQDVISVVSKSRGLTEKALDDFSENLEVRLADEALKVKLVDDLKTHSEIFETLILKKGIDKITSKDLKKLISIETYMASWKEGFFKNSVFSNKNSYAKKSDQAKIAVIIIDGAITLDSSNEDMVGADDVVKQILKSKYDKSIKGVVIRINSPGGHALAADILWMEIKALRLVKPVYVSFGDIAASGGYYVGVAGEKIFAQANTITGSIGVYSVLFNVQKGAYNKLGLSFDRVVTHPYADIGSAVRLMSEQERKVIREDTYRVYKRFIEVVQEGRQFDTLENVNQVAQGRVWSGYQAKQIGLVDELGGLEDTVESLAAQLKLKGNYKVIEFYPENPFEILLRSLMSMTRGWSVFNREKLLGALNSWKDIGSLISSKFDGSSSFSFPKASPLEFTEGIWMLSPYPVIQ